MKPKWIYCLLFVLTTGLSHAQTKYFNSETTTCNVGNNTLKTTVRKNSTYIYVHDISGGRFINKPLTSRNGGLLPEDIVMGKVVVIKNTATLIDKANTLISSSISTQSKQIVKGKSLIVNVIFNPDDGKVWEVNLGFDINSPFAFVTPVEYNTIIYKLTNEIMAEINDRGKDLNYISQTWFYMSK